MLKALAGPFPNVTFCPTGGIAAETAPDFLALSNVACVGGSWLVPKAALATGVGPDHGAGQGGERVKATLTIQPRLRSSPAGS